MTVKTLYKGPTLGSLLEAQATPAKKQPHGLPEQWMFHNFTDAWQWAESLTDTDKQYLASVMTFVRNLQDGSTLISAKVKPENQELFYRCVSWTMISFDLFNQVSFSSDYSKLKRNSYRAENAL